MEQNSESNFDSCVNCHADLADGEGAYCSEACKVENESPRTEAFAPSPRQQEVQAEIEAAIENREKVRIGLNEN